MRAAAMDAASAGTIVDTLDKWFLDQAQTPAGSILLFLLLFLARLSVDQYDRRRQHRKARKRKET